MRTIVSSVILTLVGVYFAIALYGRYSNDRIEIIDNVDIVEITHVTKDIYIITAVDISGNDRYFLSNQHTVLELVDASPSNTTKILLSVEMTKTK